MPLADAIAYALADKPAPARPEHDAPEEPRPTRRLPRSQGAGVTAQLPSGTVTFLFTDIEGPRGSRALGDPRTASRARRDRRGSATRSPPPAAASSSTEGDALFVVVRLGAARRSAAAVAGAARPRRARVARRVDVRVRMGIHTGEAHGRGQRLRRARGPPRGPDRGGRPRRPGARLLGRPAPSSRTGCREA